MGKCTYYYITIINFICNFENILPLEIQINITKDFFFNLCKRSKKRSCSGRESGGETHGQGAELAGQPAGGDQAPTGQAGDREEKYTAGEGGKELGAGRV